MLRCTTLLVVRISEHKITATVAALRFLLLNSERCDAHEYCAVANRFRYPGKKRSLQLCTVNYFLHRRPNERRHPKRSGSYEQRVRQQGDRWPVVHGFLGQDRK